MQAEQHSPIDEAEQVPAPIQTERNPRGRVATVTEDPKRWKNRTVHDEADLLGPFNDKSISDLMRTAISATQRLRDDGRAVWGEGSDEDGKWRDSCHDLWKFLDTVEMRKHQGQKVEDVLRECRLLLRTFGIPHPTTPLSGCGQPSGRPAARGDRPMAGVHFSGLHGTRSSRSGSTTNGQRRQATFTST